MPGAAKLIEMINKQERKNKIIIAFVISVCLVTTLYSLGVIHFIRKLVSVVPPMPSMGSSNVQEQQHKS